MKKNALSCIKSFVLLIFTAVSFGLSGFSQAEIITLKAPRPVVWKDFLGVNTQFLWFVWQPYEQQYAQQYARQYQLLKELGLEWVRVDVHWTEHEYPQGVYHLQELDRVVGDLQKNQLKSVVYVVGSANHATSAPPGAPYPDQYPPTKPQLFSDFIGMLAQRYPSVDAWQVWNEPNLPSYWTPEPNSDEYMNLFRSANDTLRAIDPKKPVVTAGMAYHSELFQRGGLMLLQLLERGLLDLNPVVAYQPYTLTPEGNDPVAKDFLSATEYINGFLRGHGAQQIWATEWGWSSYPGPVDEQPVIGADGQADYMLRRLALMSAQDFNRIFLFTLSDLTNRASSIRDQSYGLIDLAGNPKPAYTALKNYLNVTGPQLTPADPPPLSPSNPKATIYTIAWKRNDGRNVLVYWGDPYTNIVKIPAIYQATLHNPLTGAQQTVTGGNEGITVMVTDQVRMLVW